MELESIANLFSNESKKEDAFMYLKDEGVIDMLESHPQQDIKRFPPNYPDLARLHKIIRSRKCFTVLEFGLGYSTIVMADAILKNKQGWKNLSNKPRIRNSTLFQVHAVDTLETWIEKTREMLPKGLGEIVKLHYSTVSVGTFQSRACHYYDSLPNVIPDIIYLDGPDPTTAIGDIYGLNWSNRDRVVMAADILMMEPQLLPGTLIIVDGRAANSRFIKSHMYRNWSSAYNSDSNVSVFELQESPLGEISAETMRYCLGERINDWASD